MIGYVLTVSANTVVLPAMALMNYSHALNARRNVCIYIYFHIYLNIIGIFVSLKLKHINFYILMYDRF
jgi:hypothetical protein